LEYKIIKGIQFLMGYLPIRISNKLAFTQMAKSIHFHRLSEAIAFYNLQNNLFTLQLVRKENGQKLVILPPFLYTKVIYVLVFLWYLTLLTTLEMQFWFQRKPGDKIHRTIRASAITPAFRSTLALILIYKIMSLVHNGIMYIWINPIQIRRNKICTLLKIVSVTWADHNIYRNTQHQYLNSTYK